eukprot:TRINITY_DN16806_c1_g1_i3.p1 TRINITY_DN16806_c1_g1~~TRINITY_DN16806_c1_g1_i3.p1  ORF type:complete len:305 (+),score=54.48 TRINITY_DN16806_c1_g1_i3:52-915(+)
MSKPLVTQIEEQLAGWLDFPSLKAMCCVSRTLRSGAYGRTLEEYTKTEYEMEEGVPRRQGKGEEQRLYTWEVFSSAGGVSFEDKGAVFKGMQGFDIPRTDYLPMPSPEAIAVVSTLQSDRMVDILLQDFCQGQLTPCGFGIRITPAEVTLLQVDKAGEGQPVIAHSEPHGTVEPFLFVLLYHAASCVVSLYPNTPANYRKAVESALIWTPSLDLPAIYTRTLPISKITKPLVSPALVLSVLGEATMSRCTVRTFGRKKIEQKAEKKVEDVAVKQKQAGGKKKKKNKK